MADHDASNASLTATRSATKEAARPAGRAVSSVFSTRATAEWLHTTDAAALHRDLAAAGVPIVKEIEDGPFGRHFAFADPEGYVITVHDGK